MSATVPLPHNFCAASSLLTLFRMAAIAVLLKSKPEARILQHVYCLYKYHECLNIMSVAAVMVMVMEL